MSSTMKRGGSVMSKPAEGWLHPDTALGRGQGVFYSFPVHYVGSVEFKQSLRGLTPEEQTAVIREGIAQTVEKAQLRRPDKRKVHKKILEYAEGHIKVFRVDVSLGLSASGFLIAPLTVDQNTLKVRSPNPAADGIIAHHEMSSISLAAGGEDADYDMVAYVGKDKTGARACHVFDCGFMSDDCLATIGQSFVLAQQLADEKKAAELRRQIQEEEAMYARASSMRRQGTMEPVYDQASRGYAPESNYADLPAHAAAANPGYAMGALRTALPGGDNPGYAMSGFAPPVPKPRQAQPQGETYLDVVPSSDTYLDVKPANNDNYLDVKPANNDNYLDVKPATSATYLDVVPAGRDTYLDVQPVGRYPNNDSYFEVAPRGVPDTYLDVQPGQGFAQNPNAFIAATMNSTNKSKSIRRKAAGGDQPGPAWVYIDPSHSAQVDVSTLPRHQ